MAGLQLGEGFTHHFLRQAGTFPTLAGDTQGLADVTIAAAPFHDCFTDLSVGNTLAEADIHIRNRR